MNLSASVDPHYAKDIRVESLTTSNDPTTLAWVEFDRLSIQSCDAAAMRRLAAAIVEAADLIDQGNAEIAAAAERVPA